STAYVNTLLSTLSLHDALPIFELAGERKVERGRLQPHASIRDFRLKVKLNSLGRLNLNHELVGLNVRSRPFGEHHDRRLFVLNQDRKSTRLNSSHVAISYAVFC